MEEETEEQNDLLRMSESDNNLESADFQQFNPTDSAPILAEEVKDEHHKNGASFFSVFFNMMNATVGAGILSLPFAMKSMGFVFGTLSLAIVALVSAYTLYLLVLTADKMKIYHYKLLVVKLFEDDSEKQIRSKIAGFLLDFCLFINCLGTIIGYSVMCSSLISYQLEAWFLPKHDVVDANPYLVNFLFFITDRAFILTLVMVFLMFPLSLLRHIRFLSYSSFFSVLSVCFVVTIVIIRCIQNWISPYVIRKPIANPVAFFVPASWNQVIDSLISLPVVIFAYASHNLVLNFYAEKKNKAPKSMGAAIFLQIICIFLFYLLMSVFGFSLFLEKTPSNILTGFPDDVLFIFARFAIAIVIILSYPLFHYPTRDSIEKMFFHNKPFSYIRWTLITVSTCSFVYVISILIPNIVIIFGFTGSTTGVVINFVFPTMMYIIAEPSWKHRTPAIIVFLLSTAFGILATIAVTYDIIQQILADWKGILFLS